MLLLTGLACLVLPPYILAKEAKPPFRQISLVAQLSHHYDRSNFYHLIAAFEDLHPNIQIDVRFYKGDYSKKLEEWVSGDHGPDIFYWYSGKHIERLAKQNKLQKISLNWQRHQWQKLFPAAVNNAMKYQEEYYGVPASYYPWALYYRQSLFEKYQIAVPHSLADIFQACLTFNKHNLSMFSIGTKASWSMLAWFDYLNIRLHGQVFHRQLLAGQVSWNSLEVKKVLTLFSQLIENKCFNLDSHKAFNAIDHLPLIYNGLSAMTLSGGYMIGSLPQAIKSDFKVVPFPKITNEKFNTTIVPIDAFVVPWYAKLDEPMNLFLDYLTSVKFQHLLNEPSTRLPPNMKAQTLITEPLQLAMKAIIAKGDVIQYFDRETHPVFSLMIADIIVDFIDHQNITLTLKQLEQASREFYQSQAALE
ncbi:MAG: ABC transporter substrate-binding protein [Thalassotalea sp.]